MGREEMDSRRRGNNGEWAGGERAGTRTAPTKFGRRVAVSAEGGVGV